MIFENTDGDYLVDLKNHLKRQVSDSYYLFTQKKCKKHYFVSIMGELSIINADDAFGEDDPEVVFNFDDHFGDFDPMNYDFTLSSDEKELKIRHLDYRKGGAITEYKMTEVEAGLGFT